MRVEIAVLKVASRDARIRSLSFSGKCFDIFCLLHHEKNRF